MNGLIVVNKPKDYTSRDIVNILNNIFHEKKIGHTGTLDPIASGVLVICIGKYTHLVESLTALDKEYIAEMELGIQTDTGDITGNIIKKDSLNVSLEQIKEVFNNFPESYEQTVPKYSAVKVNGKKLYEYAREGIEVTLPKRLVHIYSLEILDFKDNVIRFKTKVSKGTYIRQLIEDLGSKLNTVATMKSLVRTKQGIFNIEDSVSVDDIENNNFKLLTVEDVFDYPIIEVTDDTKNRFLNGNKINLDVSDGKYFIKDNNEVLAIYEFINKEGRVIVKL